MKPPGVWIAAVPCLFLAILSGCSQREKPLEPEHVQAKPHVYNRVIVLCIGINKYQYSGIPALDYAEPDANGFAQVVRSRYGYETAMLLGKDATRKAIGAKLGDYAVRLGEKDVLIVFFAGHGQVIELPSYGRAGFLIPYDANLDLDDRSDPDAWSGQALDMRLLVESLGGMKAHHVVLIADACSSGFMTGRGNFADRPDLQVLLTQPSRMVMAAATERQKAREDATTGHGRFTMALLDVLKSPDAASVTDVFNEVRKRVIKNNGPPKC
ncbi:MAG: caspase family protein [Actinomycetota bacterium]